VTDAGRHHGPPNFQVGELVLLLDRKKRRYLVTLEEGGEFHTHSGFICPRRHRRVRRGRRCGRRAGPRSHGAAPTLSDFVLKMPRGAQVIYPKDLGPILMLADIGPGARVLESGVGSGALSMTMLRCRRDIVGYELREDFAARAQKNVAASAAPRH
jgi:tRNA (adenine57-N1/adenine58-N1)-methyltransferase